MIYVPYNTITKRHCVVIAAKPIIITGHEHYSRYAKLFKEKYGYFNKAELYLILKHTFADLIQEPIQRIEKPTKNAYQIFSQLPKGHNYYFDNYQYVFTAFRKEANTPTIPDEFELTEFELN